MNNNKMSPGAVIILVVSSLITVIWGRQLNINFFKFNFFLESQPLNHYSEYIVYRTIFMFMAIIPSAIRYQYIKTAKKHDIEINYWFETEDGDAESFWWVMVIFNPEMVIPIALIYYLINGIVSIIIHYKKDPYFNDNIIDDEK